MFQALRIDQQRRWRNGERVLVEWYVQQHPGFAQDTVALTEFILEEIALRESRGEKPDLGDYIRRFPACEAALRRRDEVRTAGLFASPEVDPFSTVLAPTEVPFPAAPASPALPQSLSGPKPAVPATQDTIAAGPEAYQTVVYAPVDAAELDTFVERVEGPRVPGFEILSELGRGGMGIVYKARQLSADRLVALKVVRNDLLETLPLASRTSTLERFQHEAQAAAKLEHDNLVTVFEVGTANRLRYYAMRFVDGRSLYDMLRDGPLDNRRAAAYLEPVARGLHYAHEHGILHRDLKPHNILVDRHSDRPLVADFGLAKFTERRDELTHAGEVMGTPSYMPPEQAQDAACVTASADVYSLGATLYHLLTLRPPFQAANVAETIRQIIYEEPVSPRQLNPAIDRDLGTICLKCLQKEPARRYGSAGLLADDLRRYLNGEPILARPISWVGRTWRWCRRKPVLAGLIATATMLAIVSLAAIGIGTWNTVAALSESDASLRQVMQAVDELFTRVSEDELFNEPGLQPVRRDLLGKALKHYQSLLTQRRKDFFLVWRRSDPAIRDELATTQFRVALITQELGSPETALAEFVQVRDLQQHLLKETPDSPRRLKEMSDTLNALGYLQGELGSLVEAAQTFKDAVEIRTRLVAAQPRDPELRRLLANTLMNLGKTQWERGVRVLPLQEPKFVDEALTRSKEARTLRLEILRQHPDQPKVQLDLASGLYHLGMMEFFLGKQESVENRTQEPAAMIAAADGHLREAIAVFEELVLRESRSLEKRYRLASIYRVLGVLQTQRNDSQAPVPLYDRARSIIEPLAAANPDVTKYQAELVNLWLDYGELLEREGRVTGSMSFWAQAVVRLRELVKKQPTDYELRRSLAITLHKLAKFDSQNGSPPLARERLVEAQALMKQLLHEDPQDVELKTEVDEIQAILEKPEKST